MWCSVAVMNYFETRKYTAMHDMCKKIVYISEIFFPDTIVYIFDATKHLSKNDNKIHII